MNILVTGGASGLGRAITIKLAQDSEDMIFFTYKDSSKQAEELEQEYPNTKGFHCDFSNNESLNEFIRQIGQLDLDVLINNAMASYTRESFLRISKEIFLKSFQENVYPTISITQEVLRTFRDKKAGKIINILTSYLINEPPLGLSEYVANKAYLLSMSKSWGSEFSKYNVTSNCISPSFMETEFTSNLDSRIVEILRQKEPQKRFLKPEEAAEVVSILIRSREYINGANVVVDSSGYVI